MKSAVKFTLSAAALPAAKSVSPDNSVQRSGHGRVIGLGVAKWSFVWQVSIASN